MARSIKHTVDREPIVLEIGGETFTAPPIIAPAALADLLDKHAEMQGVFQRVSQATTVPGGTGQSGAMKEVLDLVGEIFNYFLPPQDAERFRERLYSRDRPFDLQREVLPTVVDLVEEYAGPDRPTQPSSPSSPSPPGAGTASTAGLPQQESTLAPLVPLATST